MSTLTAVTWMVIFFSVFALWSATAALAMFGNFLRAPNSMGTFASLFYRTTLLEKVLLAPGAIWLGPLILLVTTIRRLFR